MPSLLLPSSDCVSLHPGAHHRTAHGSDAQPRAFPPTVPSQQVRVANFMGAGRPKAAKVLAAMGSVCTGICVAALVATGTWCCFGILHAAFASLVCCPRVDTVFWTPRDIVHFSR